MAGTILYSFGAIAVLLVASAFFSGSETALTAVSRGRMHQLEKDGSRAAASVNALVGNRERLIGAVLLGNTFVNILASSLATALLESRFGRDAVAATTILMTVIIVIFAEVLPKTLAITHTARFALAVAPTLRRVVAVLAPVSGALQFLVWRVLRLFGVKAEQDDGADAAHDDIRGAVELHHIEGTVERGHRDMIGGILDLGELTVADITRHRKDVTSIDAALRPAEILEALMESQHTRVPLWRGNPENIVGILHAKDVVRAVVAHKGAIDAIDMSALATPPWFVPETTSLEEQLAAFRKRRSHFALVVDEYGALMGLVTLEDILDEIFGQIPDEHEAAARPDIRCRQDGTYLVDGSVPVRDLNRELDWNLPAEEATTIAGLVIHEARTIPEAGQRFAFFGYKFEVLRRIRNRITALRITPPAETPR